MDKKTKVYIVIIVALITIIVIKPVMNSGIFAGSKQNSYEISFYKPSVKNLRLLEDMKANKCISGFDYEATDKKAVVYISAAQIQKAKSYIMDMILGVTVCGISIVISKIIKQEVQVNEGKRK